MARTMIRATRLSQVISTLGRQSDLESTVEQACVNVSELFCADLAVLMLDTDAGLQISGRWGVAESDLPQSPFWLPAVDRFVGDETVRTGPGAVAPLPQWLVGYGPQHVAWVRLRVGSKPVGLLMLGRRSPDPFEASDTTELRAVAYRIALAIENGVLQQQMEQQLALLHRLQQLTTTLAGVIDVDEVGRQIARMLISEAQVTASAVILSEDDASIVVSTGGRADELGAHDGDVNPHLGDAWSHLLLEAAGKHLGRIAVVDPPPPGSPQHEVLLHLVSLGGLSLDKALLYAESQKHARHDSLTGLLGHRVFHEALEAEIDAVQTFSILMFDIDDFKLVNDLHGHQMGDQALRIVSAALRQGTRDTDTVFRIGGEEFCALLPGLEAGHALPVADKLRHLVADAIGDELPIPVTVSVGIASYPSHGNSRDALISAADVAMYASKRGGKNCSSVAGGAVDGNPRSRPRDAGLTLLHGKDPDTASHSVHVAILSVEVGTALGLDDTQLDRLRTAARLHDIGKIGVPDAILNKPGPLDDEEFRIVKTHPVVGGELLDSWGLREAATIVRQHHERVDGRGYPDGLSANEIQIEARIIHVADAYMAMTRDRPYRPAMPEQQAAEELQRHAGSQFDPDVVAALLARARARRDGDLAVA